MYLCYAGEGYHTAGTRLLLPWLDSLGSWYLSKRAQLHDYPNGVLCNDSNQLHDVRMVELTHCYWGKSGLQLISWSLSRFFTLPHFTHKVESLKNFVLNATGQSWLYVSESWQKKKAYGIIRAQHKTHSGEKIRWKGEFKSYTQQATTGTSKSWTKAALAPTTVVLFARVYTNGWSQVPKEDHYHIAVRNCVKEKH